jgi:hypothetical protein
MVHEPRNNARAVPTIDEECGRAATCGRAGATYQFQRAELAHRPKRIPDADDIRVFTEGVKTPLPGSNETGTFMDA